MATYARWHSDFLRLDILDTNSSQEQDPNHSHKSSEYDAGPVLRTHSPQTQAILLLQTGVNTGKHCNVNDQDSQNDDPPHLNLIADT